jgi:di/tricarboxylate transporter
MLTAILGQLISNTATALSPAGYEFGDYWKRGRPMLLWFFVVAAFPVPVLWPF